MKKTLHLLLIILISGCQGRSSKTEKVFHESNNEVVQPVKVEKEIVTRTYIAGLTECAYDFETRLKNGFRIEHRFYKESNDDDTLQAIFLMKDTIEIKDLTGGYSYDLLHKNVGYIGADFDSSFVFVQSFGSGNPSEIQLVDKTNGDLLKKGIWVDVYEEHQILLYIEDVNEDVE